MKALLIIVPILLIGGVFGAAFMGVINIPGVTPEKAAGKGEDMYGEGEEMYGEGLEDPADLVVEEVETVEEPEPVEEAGPVIDPELGAQQLAKYWDEIDSNKLVLIMEGYEDIELALVLFYMKRENVAELLELVLPERAAILSKEIQKLASVVKEESF